MPQDTDSKAPADPQAAEARNVDTEDAAPSPDSATSTDAAAVEEGEAGRAEPESVPKKEPKSTGRGGKKVAALKARIKELEAEKERLEAAEAHARERWMRSAAEFENFRRRTMKEKAELIRGAAEGVATKLLDVMDALFAARIASENGAGQAAADRLREGIGLISAKLEGVLESEGVRAIETEIGADFDPHVHEALAQVPSDELPAHAIHSVVQRGYLLGEKVLRPARVTVVAEPEPAEAPAESADEGDDNGNGAD